MCILVTWSLYRRGSSISATLQHPSLSFHPNHDNIDTINIADGPRVGAHHDSRGLDGHVSMGHTIEDRLDDAYVIRYSTALA